MADAGRILIIPKGNYNAEITYEVLDLVFNNGNSWLCKKTTKGIDPSDSNAEYWYKFTNFDSIIKNNVTTSEEGFALDARQGKVLMEAINGVSARVTSLSESTTASVSDLDAKINEAKNIAKGRNQARVFATTDAMKEWLKNAANKGIANQGDNLYIVTKDVPDYWVEEVLDTPNDEGYYYEVEELETQKVDLTTLNAAVDQLTNDIADVNGKLMRMINIAFTTDNMGEYIIGQKIIPIFMTTNNSEYYPKFEFYNYNNDIKVRVTNFSVAEYKIIPDVYFNCNLYYFDI